MEAPRSLKNGRFSVTRRLGEGGMAIVHEAYDHDLAVWRAVKFLKPELSNHKSLRRRFLGEARALAQLEHPNVVRVFDVGEENGWPYILMTLTRGGSLEAWVERNGAMPPRLALEAMIQVCAGVDAAHAAGIIHRDLKPDNVLITVKGRCKVTDFGIAMVDPKARSTRTGSVMGTMGFMAPEQLGDAKHVGVPADVFALGATVFSLVTGELPANLSMAEHRPELIAGVDERIRAALLKAITFAPEDRYTSAGAFAEALSAVLPAFPVVADASLAGIVTQPTPVPDRVDTDLPVAGAATAVPELDEPISVPYEAEEGFREDDAPRSVMPYVMPTMDRSPREGLPDYIDEGEDERQRLRREEQERLLVVPPEEIAAKKKVEEEKEKKAAEAEAEAGGDMDVLENLLGLLQGGMDILITFISGPLKPILIPLTALSLVVGGILLFGVMKVRAAAHGVGAARNGLYASIEQESRLLLDLEAIRANHQVPASFRSAVKAAEEPEKLALAMRYIGSAHSELESKRGSPPPEAAHRVAMADARLARLDASMSHAQQALLDWERAADGGLGALVCGLRLTDCPR